jgi:hypothetical protein
MSRVAMKVGEAARELCEVSLTFRRSSRGCARAAEAVQGSRCCKRAAEGEVMAVREQEGDQYRSLFKFPKKSAVHTPINFFQLSTCFFYGVTVPESIGLAPPPPSQREEQTWGAPFVLILKVLDKVQGGNVF